MTRNIHCTIAGAREEIECAQATRARARVTTGSGAPQEAAKVTGTTLFCDNVAPYLHTVLLATASCMQATPALGLEAALHKLGSLLTACLMHLLVYPVLTGQMVL